MERTFIRISPENLITVALLSGVAYLGVVGATMVVNATKGKVAKATTSAAPASSAAST